MLGAQDKVDVSVANYGHWRDRGMGNSDVDVYNYTEGTLPIDIINSDMSQLLWRGSARGVMESQSSSEEKVNSVISKIMKDYPPSRVTNFGIRM